jgi:propanol-preferring alcohol dehydrogenase
MVLESIGAMSEKRSPLRYADVSDPAPLSGEILIRISVCGVCHTELDEIEGRTAPPLLPVIPGHQVVGTVVARGDHAERFASGDRVGVAWIFSACGTCSSCRSGKENLCSQFRGTGRDADGGYAELMRVHQDFAYPIPDVFSDAEAAPLLCAGAIGYRSIRLSGIADGQHLGLTGFGASAHLVLKMIRHRFPHTGVYVFARSDRERGFAKELGALWSGETTALSPQPLDAIIDTTPAWLPLVEALKNLAPGGRLVINAIRKEDRDKGALQGLDYAQHLWMEKEVLSVANVARSDVSGFLELAAGMHLKPEVHEYPLSDANHVLHELRTEGTRGAKVLRMHH